jgi:hypothetical protein
MAGCALESDWGDFQFDKVGGSLLIGAGIAAVSIRTAQR